MLVKTFLSSFLCSSILLGIITTTVSFGSWDFSQGVEAQLDSKSQSTAEAAIKKTYDALVAAGLKGTPSNLIDTGQGFAKIFRDTNGAIAFVIFWTPSTGAHAVSGAIMQTYKSEGWHISDLGYPTSDEKDLAGVTNGRFNAFQKGVIAMIKGKSAQVFTTVQDAVAKLKVTAITEAQIVGGLTLSTLPDYKVRVQFNSITVHIDRDDDRGFGSNSGEYSIRAVVNGMYVDLDKASRGQLRDVDSSETVYFVPYLATTTVTIPSRMPLSIYTLAYEEDCSRGGFGNVVTEPAIVPILKDPKSEWNNEIRRIIDGALDQVTSSCNDKLGFINEIYEYPNLGAGEHSIKSNHGYYPDNPKAPGEYTLRYTISVERIEKQPSANAQQFIPQDQFNK